MNLKIFRTALPSILLVLCLTVTSAAVAFSISLEWDPVSEPAVAGYKVVYGFSSRHYTHEVDAGSASSMTISGLQAGTTYYFAAVAYGVDGQQSDYSNEVTYTPAAAPEVTDARQSDYPANDSRAPAASQAPAYTRQLDDTGKLIRTPDAAPAATSARQNDSPAKDSRPPDGAHSPACSFVIWPSGQSFSSFGGTGTVFISTTPGCSWSASVNASWMSIASKTGGDGPGIIRYTVSSAAAGVSRAAVIAVAGKSFIVNQSARYRINKR